MAMKFDSIDRPERGIMEKLTNNNTPFKKVPFPTQVEEPMVNFQEVLASERYKDVVDNYNRYAHLGLPLIDVMCIRPLQIAMMSKHELICEAELGHAQELEELAVKLVIKEFAIPDGAVNFVAKLKQGGEKIDSSDFSKNKEQSQKPEVDIDNEEEEFDDGQKEHLEISKRRIINAIIQGASKRGHYMYHNVEDDIKRITNNETIIVDYGVLMSINDALYWQYPDEVINCMCDEEDFIAGKERVDRSTNPPTIYAEGFNFPILVHELVKGVMELFAIQGLPDTYDLFKSEVDSIYGEAWDLRLGPAIWKRLRAKFPDEILIDEDKIELQNYLLVEIFKLPALDFLRFIRNLLKNLPEADQTINRLMEIIKNPPTEDVDDDEDY